jgi:hypothetical protein
MKSNKDQLREEYSEKLIKSGERGKHVKRFREGTNMVLIAPDLHKFFPDSEAVNKALREYLEQHQTTP